MDVLCVDLFAKLLLETAGIARRARTRIRVSALLSIGADLLFFDGIPTGLAQV
jgi:hypothetical protein